MSQIGSFFFSIQFLEGLSLVTGLLYIFYLIKEKRIAWFFAFVSSTILTIIVFTEKIYLQTLLNFFYALMAIYGFIMWSRKDDKNKSYIKISEYSIKSHLIIIFVTVLVSGSLATILEVFANSSYSTLDAIIFAFSILATYMQAHKILSNWLYWVVIDILTTILYLTSGLYFVSLLMVVYIVLAVFGYKKWRKKYLKQN